MDDSEEEQLTRDILILYGSETGTAEDAAERIGRETRRHHFHTRVVSMGAYTLVWSCLLSPIPWIDDRSSKELAKPSR